MALIWKKLKKLLSASDYFNSANMLRFEKEDEYKTITGGIVSLAIIVVITVAFTKEILITLERTSIQVKSNMLKVDIPTKSSVTLSPQQSQMFALQLPRYTPSSSLRYFDILAQVYDYETVDNFGVQQSTTVNMVECTSDHWEGFQSVNSVYALSGLFCPELGTNFDIFGKFSSGKQRNFNLYVTPCDPTLNSSKPCANQMQMEFYWMILGGTLPYNIFYLNTILTPDQPQYKRVYFEERGYGYIGPTFGSDAALQLAQYSITTDQSIWPFSDEITDDGLFIPYGLEIKNFPKTQMFPYYLHLRLRKSTDKYTYERTVQKLSTIFSYIGGVISSLLAALFIINKYTSFNFEISMANQLFKKQNSCSDSSINSQQMKKDQVDQQKQQEDNTIPMNIFLYFKYNVYSFLKNTLKSDLKSEHLDYLRECHQQMKKQLDIKRIIKRINCLEHCISNIVEKQKLKGLLITQPIALEQIKKNRMEFENQEKQSLLLSDAIKIEKEAIIVENYQIMQHYFSEQCSAQGIIKRKTIDNYVGLQKDTEEQQHYYPTPQQNDLRKGSLLNQKPNTGQKSDRISRNMKLKMNRFLTQEKCSNKEDDIYEIPIEYCNYQKQ